MKQINHLFLFILFVSGIQMPGFSQQHVGDTLKFWSVTYIDWPPLQGTPQREVNAVCKKVGEHCYVFVEDKAKQPSQTDIDNLVKEFDNSFYDSLTARYGPVPDALDHDPKVFILVQTESNWGGYYDPAQQMPDSVVFARWGRHSSEREIIYVAAKSFAYAPEMVAHEFGHLLHWQQDHSPSPEINPVKYWEDAWVDEGFSTFAAIFLTENIFQHGVRDKGTFFAINPDSPLIYFSSYNKVKLFMLFMFEHFGGWNYISALIKNQADGIEGVAGALKQLEVAETFDEVFEQWIIANYADDSLYEGGKFAYSHYNFLPCNVAASYAKYPVKTISTTVTPYAADYITFSATSPSPVRITFDGQLNSKFRLVFVLEDAASDHIDTLIRVPIDENNHADFSADKLGIEYDRVVMIVMNVDATIPDKSSVPYSYTATRCKKKKK